MPVTSGWIKCTKVKDDGGKSNRYAKRKAGKEKTKNSQRPGRGGGGGGGGGGEKSQELNGYSASSGQSDTDSDDSDAADDADEELMYRHSSSSCTSCRQAFAKSDATLRCLAVSSCDAEFHIICLSKHFLRAEEKAGFAERDSQIIPVAGDCPRCKTELLWGDLVRFKRGCYKKQLEGADEAVSGKEDGDHWADLLSQR